MKLKVEINMHSFSQDEVAAVRKMLESIVIDMQLRPEEEGGTSVQTSGRWFNDNEMPIGRWSLED